MEKRETTPTTPPPNGGTGGEVPKEVPTPPPNPPRTPAVPDPAEERKELRRKWTVSMERLKTKTVVPEWFEDPAEIDIDRQNLLVEVKVTPETEGEFYQRQLNLMYGAEECWLANTGETINISMFHELVPEPAAPTVQTVTTTMNPDGLQHETRSDDVGKGEKRTWEECIAELGGDEHPGCVGVRRSGGGKR